MASGVGRGGEGSGTRVGPWRAGGCCAGNVDRLVGKGSWASPYFPTRYDIMLFFFYFSFHILDIVYIQIFLLKIIGIQLDTPAPAATTRHMVTDEEGAATVPRVPERVRHARPRNRGVQQFKWQLMSPLHAR